MFSRTTIPGALIRNIGVVAICGLVATAPVLAQTELPIEERLKRLETMLNSGTLIELLQRVEALQKELQALRGEIEVQGHQISQLKSRQRELYLDVDQRVNKIETSIVQPATVETDTATAPATDTVAQTEQTAAVDSTESTQTVAAVDTQSVVDAEATDDAIDPIKEQDAYQTAFNLLKTGRYEEAGNSFDAFLAVYSAGKYADNAQYWLGETFYVRQRFEEAIGHFRTLTENYPSSAKFPHALLKIGYSQVELGQVDEARQTFDALIAKFPQTPAARNAEKRLERLNSSAG
ncbi:MAG: tol-pal system protein YbgF [Thiotrichales bacterium]|nr:tol-pal system protein YbgF [Thiotrichales bacterium]